MAALIGAAFVIGMRTRSPAVLTAVRHTTKYVFNPRQMVTAGTPGAYASIIRHVGRTSGTVHETPIVPIPVDDGFLVVTPYGTQADWVRNVLAAGGATLITEGSTHELVEPEMVPISSVIDRIPASDRRGMGLLGIDQALRLRRAVTLLD